MIIDSDISSDPLLPSHESLETQVDFPRAAFGGFFSETEFQHDAGALGGGRADGEGVSVYEARGTVCSSSEFIGEGRAGVEGPIVFHLMAVASADAEEFACGGIEMDFGRLLFR